MDALIAKNKEAEHLIEVLKPQILLLKQNGVDVSSCNEEHSKIIDENKKLMEEISKTKDSLMRVEMASGIRQITVPETKSEPPKECKKPKEEVEPVLNKPNKETKPKDIKAKGDAKSKGNAKAVESDVVDASRLDMRVGKIVEVKRHPDADSLYVEQVDVGDGKNRQIISGLVKFCSEEELQGRLAVFLLNLKPAKMRGVLSEGMIMCASDPENGGVEPLLLPDGVVPGDRVTVEGYEGTPDEVMNPKKKVFETIKPDLRVDSNGVATYKGAKWSVKGQPGSITSNKLKDVQIS